MNKTVKEQEIVFGVHPIIELLKAKRRFIQAIYTTKDKPKSWDKILQLLSKNTQIQYVPRAVLDRLAQTTDHQGIVAYANKFQFRSKPFDPSKHKFLILLDGIQDPRNLGAIIRSAYCVGADGVIISQKNSSYLTPSALKASSGLAEYMEIQLTPTALVSILELKKSGYSIYLTTFDGENASKIQYKEPLCLVIGSEGKGVSSDTLKSGNKITIPQVKSDISYNASVAAGILLFLIAEQLQSFKKIF
jgi:23S rRNA (guanosine2251-2'-O)-methyltransferase